MNSNLKSFWSIIVPLWVAVAFLGIIFARLDGDYIGSRIIIVWVVFVLNAAMHFKGCNTVVKGEETAEEKISTLKIGSWGCDMVTGTIFAIVAGITCWVS